MNRKHLVDAIVDAAQLSVTDAGDVLNALFGIIAARLKAGDVVRVVGFGKFDVVERRAMAVHNPRNGERIEVGITRRARYTPSVELRQALKQRPSAKTLSERGRDRRHASPPEAIGQYNI